MTNQISKSFQVSQLSIWLCYYNTGMFGDRLSSVRQSLEMKGSVGIKNHPTKDSSKSGLPEYSIDVQLSEKNKQILQAFKQSSGFYNVSPKKQKNVSPQQKKSINTSSQEPVSTQCPRIYLFGNKNGDYLKKDTQIQTKYLQNDTKIEEKLTNFQTTLMCSNTSVGLSISVNPKYEDFLKEVLQTLGIINSSEKNHQLQYIMDSAYCKFIDMKGNGRWQLIQRYFKNTQEDDLNYSGASNINKSIIKKKSMIETQSGVEKKKVKVIEPQSASQLIRTKYKLAEDLENHLQKLTKGYKFEKYCYNSQKVEQIYVYLSYDLKCLAWQTIGKSPVVENMLNYSGITDGARSKNYSKYANKCKIDEQLAFSIVFRNRTLDLVAATPDQKQQFVQAMKFVKSLA